MACRFTVSEPNAEVHLYVSNVHRHVTESNARWIAKSFITNTLVIHPFDKPYPPGRFYLTIQGRAAGTNAYQLQATLAPASTA
jgi:hypothetical protein